MQAKTVWRTHSRLFAIAGMIAMVLGVAVASAEVCTTPALTVNGGTDVTCSFVNAYAYGGVTVSLLVIDVDTGMTVGGTGTTPIAALKGTIHTIGPCGPATCSWFCRWTVTGNESFQGYSRGAIQNSHIALPGTLAGAALPATCNPF